MKNEFLMRPHFRILTDDQIEELHHAALEILERTGVAVNHAEARELLGSSGARIDKSNVRIPSCLVEEAIRSAPKRITIADRNGQRRIFLEGKNVYFGSTVASPNYIDPYTRLVRRFTRSDLEKTIAVSDHLANIRLIGMGTFISDVPIRLSGKVVFKEILKNSTKPIFFEALSLEDLKDCIEMATLVSGGPESLKRDPFIIHYSEQISPLIHTEEGVDKLLLCADCEIPLIYTPMPMLGQSAPATFAGILAQNTAEVLSGLVISQLRRKGAPFIFGGIPSILDMKTTLNSYGAAELDLLCAALTEVSHYYGLPMFGTAGCSDAKVVDEQTAVEVSISCLMSSLSGANLVHDVGLIGGGLTVSLETTVLADEVIEMIKHILRGIDINSETLALDLIDRVGPGGSFIAEDHTYRHFRECWYSDLFDRGTYERWETQGRMRLSDRINRRVIEILEQHESQPLPDKTASELDAMEESWE